jgi:hypothetical protein
MGMSMQQKSLNLCKLYGFSLLRNGVKYDYSFKESLLSLKPLTEEIYLALDKGEDSTETEILKFPFIKIIPSSWDMGLKQGKVLSCETNKALDALKAEHKTGWGIYLQADEVLHEDDYELIKKDIELAEEQGCDAVSFRYLHFWQTHHHLAIAKNWYPTEIRAIKLNSNIVSWGDAQSFKNYTKVFFTEARIYHYGHVRVQEIYESKMKDMSAMYDSDAKLSKYYNEKDRDKKYPTLLYFGIHPKVMKERILRMKDIWALEEKKHITIVGNPEKYSPKLLSRIAVEKISWNEKRTNSLEIITEPSCWDRILRRTNVPLKMKSSRASNWSNDFRLTLQLSEKGIGLREVQKTGELVE